MTRVFCGLMVALVAGCGGGGEAVTGTVTRAAAPLSKGAVLLEPTAGGPAASAEVSDGKFSIPAARGLKPGKYKVRVTAPEIESGSDPKLVAATQFDPWETTVDVASGQPVALDVPKDPPAKAAMSAASAEPVSGGK
jgi:hypothetical protein